jgi:hypothetical protein
MLGRGAELVSGLCLLLHVDVFSVKEI